MAKEALTFKPKLATKDLLTALADRARQIIKMRYGLEFKEPMTLEAIGRKYGITRERVRQIEEFALKTIRKSSVMSKLIDQFNELKMVMEEYGGIVHEREFLNYLAVDDITQNNVHFLLVVGDAFHKIKENDNFHHRWTTDDALAEKIQNSINNLCDKLDHNDLLTEKEIIEEFIKHLEKDIDRARAETHAQRWLKISKNIGQSPIGEWGLAKSSNVKVRGIRDYAYLIMRKHGSPMHFTEVARAISETFKKKANAATCHNELIKDKRFVLVGRGIYALSEWGYAPGIVRDVIKQILEKTGPLSRAEVIAKVLKERYVKENTIMVNLKNKKYFKESKDGKFSNV